MILISASDNNSWRHYRLRALATIRAWAYALRTCSDATLGREAEPEAEQGKHPLLFFPWSAHQANTGKRNQPVRYNDTSSLKHNALRRFCDDSILDFRADNGDFAADRSEVGVTGQRVLISGGSAMARPVETQMTISCLQCDWSVVYRVNYFCRVRQWILPVCILV